MIFGLGLLKKYQLQIVGLDVIQIALAKSTSLYEVWGEFAGKDTALKLIAGMAIALEKSGGKYVRGKNLNKSEVARSASRSILEHGDGIDVTDKALTMLINEALNTYASK
jgi:hypothetical protein